ncbi:MAG: sigma 54-interacting transcriptional regulator [Hyphomicrobiaceae bacterium]|nr:sigma 54-interacting transcriptional regulator [Hyphomicrobiaceae bacterium]
METPNSEQFRALLEAVVSFIDEGVIVATLDGRVLYHNPAAGELLGAAGNQPIKSLQSVLDIPEGASISSAIEAASRGRSDALAPSGHASDFVRFQRKLQVRGETRFLEFHSCQTCQSIGQTRLMIIRDVTERHRLEMLIDRSRGDLVTNDRKVLALLERVHQVAPSNASVLLQGESGTGKTHIARLIHRLSRRSDKPFVEVNCAAIPTSLIESELFGHLKGAFTGATRDRPGRFQAAHGGTLFLDEIAEIPMHLQAKLLRVLQDKEFEPVGSDKTVRVDIRVITASNRSLRDMVEEGEFRADLYYRLAVFTLFVPAIRDRRGDIPLLLRHFCDSLEQRGYAKGVSCSSEAMNILMNYHWPGNVRELENAVEHALICAVNGTVMPESLPEQIRASVLGKQPWAHQGASTGLAPAAAGLSSARAAGDANAGHAGHGVAEAAVEDAMARREIEAALASAKGNRSAAARLLGVDRTTLWRRMQRLHLLSPSPN